MKFTEDYLKQAHQVIVDTCQALRPELLKHFGQAEHELKKDKTVVTKLDLMTEGKLRAALTTFDSSVGLLGEEQGQSGSKQTFWLIDPIDGTEQFIRGIPVCHNQLALVDNGEVIMALLYFFVQDELFVAQKGRGATRNGEPIKVSDRPPERAWVEMAVKLDAPGVYERLVACRREISGYSLTKDMRSLITGQVEGTISYVGEGGPWDYAPRGLFLEEAGGKIANIGSDTFDFHNPLSIAGNPAVFEVLQKHFSDLPPTLA